MPRFVLAGLHKEGEAASAFEEKTQNAEATAELLVSGFKIQDSRYETACGLFDGFEEKTQKFFETQKKVQKNSIE